MGIGHILVAQIRFTLLDYNLSSKYHPKYHPILTDSAHTCQIVNLTLNLI
jgi:hypothetical protein